jgi:hypothetical protein
MYLWGVQMVKNKKRKLGGCKNEETVVFGNGACHGLWSWRLQQQLV